jgi:hypothetical protein
MGRKSIVSILTFFIVNALCAQSLVLNSPYDGGIQVNSDTVKVIAVPSEFIVERDIHVTQSTVATMDVNVRRYELAYEVGMDNYFCWAVCYPSVPNGDSLFWDSPTSLQLDQGIVAKDFHAYLKPNGLTGTNLYLYSFYNTANGDSSSVYIQFSVYNAGDINQNNVYDSTEIAGDVNGDGILGSGEIAGDVDGSGDIAGGEVTGDINGSGVIDGAEVLGDVNGNGILESSEINTGISANAESDLTFSIYPNPSNGGFSVTSDVEITNLKIYSIVGELVYQENINSRDVRYEGSLSSGVYFVHINNLTSTRLVVR